MVLTPGDIILVYNGRSFVARGITYFMKRYIRKHGYKYKPYHHAATVIRDEGKLKIAEANAAGWQIGDKLPKHYDVFTPIVPFTDVEQQLISECAKQYSYKVTRYDFINFIWWMWYFTFGNWIGRDNERLYCSEGAAELGNTRHGMFKNPQRTNPVDIATNQNYRMK